MIDVHVRGIDPEVWRALRVEAVRQNISVARLIENLWFARAQQLRDQQQRLAVKKGSR